MKLKIFSYYLFVLISIISVSSSKSSNIDDINLQHIPSISSICSQHQYVPYIEESLKSNDCEKIKLNLTPVRDGDPVIYLDVIEKSTNQQAGKIMFHIVEKTCRLRDIRLEEKHQGKGLGKAALINFYTLMDKLGVDITTCVLKSKTNYTANLYLSVGMRFRLDEFKPLIGLDNFSQFLNNSSVSNSYPMEMFRVGNTPFNSSKMDQEETFWRLKNKHISL